MEKIFLVCTYKNENEELLITEAASQAFKNSSNLIILTIIDSTETSEMPYETIIEDYHKSMQKLLNRYCEVAKEELPNLNIIPILKDGFIVDTIISVLKEYDDRIKVIFLGSKNKDNETTTKIIGSALKVSNAKIIICPMKN